MKIVIVFLLLLNGLKPAEVEPEFPNFMESKSTLSATQDNEGAVELEKFEVSVKLIMGTPIQVKSSSVEMQFANENIRILSKEGTVKKEISYAE
jgi:hypothetical protein